MPPILLALAVVLSFTAIPARATFYEFQNTTLFTFRSIETDVTARDASITGWIELEGTYAANPVDWDFTVAVVGGETFHFRRPTQIDQFNYGVARISSEGDSRYDFTTGHVLHTNLSLKVVPSNP